MKQETHEARVFMIEDGKCLNIKMKDPESEGWVFNSSAFVNWLPVISP